MEAGLTNEGMRGAANMRERERERVAKYAECALHTESSSTLSHLYTSAHSLQAPPHPEECGKRLLNVAQSDEPAQHWSRRGLGAEGLASSLPTSASSAYLSEGGR
jgi:hypothetical protein